MASTRDTLQSYIGECACVAQARVGSRLLNKVGVVPERACDPSLHEPNLSINLEIAELVNTKKANT